MAGTKEGNRKVRDALLAKDPEHYSKISRRAKKPRGGVNSANGFNADRRRAAQAGEKSKRTKLIRKGINENEENIMDNGRRSGRVNLGDNTVLDK